MPCVLLVLLLMAGHAAGQGLLPSNVPPVGASNSLSQLQLLYRNSKAWKSAYKQRPSSACSRTGGASLCAAQATSTMNAYAQLMLATSPQAYSTTWNNKVRLVAPAQDQAECQACTAFAMAAAAETAMATALQVDVQQCSISVQALYFCTPNGPIRSCDAGWSLQAALQQLQERGQSLPTSSCLPYKPDLFGDQSAAAMCNGPCKTPNMHAGRGKFSSQMITSVWKAQQHIRQHGAVVSRFDLYSDFRSFFADKRNAQAVYRPSPGAYFKEYHAITLVGYDNEQQYWLAKNSYGSDWADKGLFKVAFGVCAILAADKGEAYGIVWTPSSVPVARQLPVTAGPRKDCYWYQAQPGDYLSKVAWLAGIRLDTFMLDNTGVVKDLDAQLQGVQLLLCNPAPGNIKVLKTDPQLEALLRVKAAIDTTGKLEDWRRAAGVGGGYCEWRGVFCIEGSNTVYALYISPDNGIRGLKGTLPQAAAFDGLAALTEIGIHDHLGIGGTIPADWSRLSQLQSIWLGNNSLSGTITPSWGNLTKLRLLHMFNNKLSGSIHASFRALSAIEDVDVSTNALSGTIPDLSSLTRLRVLYLVDNKLSGPIPASVKALINLEELDVSTNALSGTIPDLGSLTKLRVLNLHTNKLSGSIPTSFKALTALQELSVHTNELSGTIPDLNRLTKVQLLYLYKNKLSGSIPSGLRALTTLEELHVSSNGLSGTIPDLGSLTKLRVLALSENKLSGSIPTSFRALAALQELSVHTNGLSGTIPDLGSLTKLQLLYLSHNKLSGSIPAGLRALTNLEELDVSSNALSGIVPDLGSLTRLRVANMYDNKLSMSIPATFRALAALEELDISNNTLTGTIPDLGSLTKLRMLYLHDNKLNGPILASLGSLKALQHLVLSYNGLSGSIPASLKALAALEELFLSYNGLSGTVPPSLSSMRRLKDVAMRGNSKLGGCLPTSWRQQLSGVDIKKYIYDGTRITGFC